MSPEQYKPDQFKNDLKRVLSLIRTGQRYLEDGKVVELSALESRIADLCEQAHTLAPDQRKEVAPLLAALTEELGQFEARMEKEYSDIQRQLRGISNTAQATNAYAQAARTK
ncbi:hypothetical protein HED22_14185 [Thalassospira sp. HF15]|uniref:hypothetical protein n=1 Tax=Thalassospira sp. HF15 TaxID=2722755 RepID=UPI001431E385|nr:hypothetical protein [Thalassospira sp. HF15]NIY76798.1 hypothetical protein [Thalassospira sp. HF15]